MKEPISLSDITTPYWKIFIYGGPGVGKTVFASGSKTMRTFIFDVDDGVHSANAFIRRSGGDTSKIKVWKVTIPQDFYDGMNWLIANINQIDLAVIDTATELQRIILADIMTKSKHIKADFDDWGTIKNAMEMICIRLRSLECHVIFNGHEFCKSENDSDIKVWRPAFDGAFGLAYARQFSMIGRMLAITQQKREGELKTMVTSRAINFTLDPAMHSKDRSTMMKPWMKLNIDEMMAILVQSTTDVSKPDTE